MRHLIIGGGGFVGQHLIRALSATGDEVTVIDRSPAPATEQHVPWSVHDFSAGPFPKPVPAADVVHCLVGTYRGGDADMLAANVHALHHSLSSLVSAPGLVLYVGAGSIYGERAERVTEDHPPAPTTMYGLTKWLSESVLMYHAARVGFPYVVLRPTNIYGPGNRKNVFWAFYDALQKHGLVTVFGDGTQARDFAYVGDVVDLIVRVVEPSRRAAVANQVFNVAGAESHTVLDVLRAMSTALGREIPVRYAPSEGGVLAHFGMSTAKAKRLVGWRPRKRFEDGVRETLASYGVGLATATS
jgi:UDP-glucose 4-epimerase